LAAVLSTFSSTSTTANAERFNPWTLSSDADRDRIGLLVECLTGTATDADIRASIGGVNMHFVAAVTQQTNRRIAYFELLRHELPPSGAQDVRVYWPSATRIHVIGIELEDTRQRYTPSGDIFSATSASATNANLTATAPTNDCVLFSAVWVAATATWSANSGQTTIGSNNQQSTFACWGGYEVVSSGSQASDWGHGAAASALGQLCIAIADGSQALSSLDPADDATGVSTSPDLELTFADTAVEGTGSLTVYETTAPSTAPSVDAAATSQNATNATAFSVDVSGLSLSAGKRLFVCIAHDGGASVLTDDGSPSPWHGVLRGTGSLVAWRECDGSEPSSYGFTSTPGEGLIARAFAVSGHDPETPPIFNRAEGNGTAPNPPSVTFPWGTEPTTVITWGRYDGGATPTGFPASYTGTGAAATAHGTAGDRAAHYYGYRTGLTGGSEDPATFTGGASELWTVFTIGIRPADPSTPVDVIDAADAVFAGSTATFSAAGLAGSTAHHVKLDAGAVLDYAGIQSRTAWSFTTDAGGPGLVEGEADTTDAGDTVDGAGSVALGADGAATDGSDTADASGGISVSAEGAAAEDGDSAAAAGSIGTSGDGDGIEGGDGADGSGDASVAGAGDATDAGDTASAAASVGVGATGSATDDADGIAATGVVTTPGSSETTDAGDVVDASGDSGGTATGELATTDGTDGVDASGTVETSAAGTTTDEADGFAGAGQLPVGGSGDTVDVGDAIEATGSGEFPVRQGQLATTDSGDEVAASGAVSDSGAAVVLEAGDEAPGAGSVALTGALDVTEAGDTVAAAGHDPTLVLDPIPRLTATWTPGVRLSATHTPGRRLTATWSSSQ
jgi:hypothetical protein